MDSEIKQMCQHKITTVMLAATAVGAGEDQRPEHLVLRSRCIGRRDPHAGDAAHRKTAEYDCGKCPNSWKSPRCEKIRATEQAHPGGGIRRDRPLLPAALDRRRGVAPRRIGVLRDANVSPFRGGAGTAHGAAIYGNSRAHTPCGAVRGQCYRPSRL